ncbi:UNVERIFIED_CONTAM: hypothetical protein Sradi_6174800 [Sesamum radiatum]|uniref:Uncharacterized protein n=1 Tax=Sesamum radiatum TaxID=300843 RepID=A0AAW2KA24_SESRA
MDKEGKKRNSKEKGSSSLPPRRGQIKAKIIEEWKETLRVGWKRGDDQCGSSNSIISQESNGRAD